MEEDINTKGTQTEWADYDYANRNDKHNCSFSFDMLENSFTDLNVQENINQIEAQIKNSNMKLLTASKNVSDLQEEVDYFEAKRFSID